MTNKTRTAEVIEIAAAHGLTIAADSVRFNDAGLDYQVAFATEGSGKEWVLRIPRRADVSAKIADEARILALVKNELSVAVPDWRIQSTELIAYPALPGFPGPTVESGLPAKARFRSNQLDRPRLPATCPADPSSNRALCLRGDSLATVVRAKTRA